MTPTKNGFIQKVFSEVPKTYERVNHVLTLGLDILWRKRATRIAANGKSGRWIDMCTGTGETAAYLNRLAPNGTAVYALDFSLPMLGEARRKQEADSIHFVNSDVRSLPFPNESFDLITISFATRNINLSEKILIENFAEFYRILKPGGCFVNLETSQPSSRLVRKGLHLYVKLFVEKIGSWISGSRPAYKYLSNTIPRFYSAEELTDIMHQAGFEKVTFQSYLLGVAAIHQAIKQK